MVFIRKVLRAYNSFRRKVKSPADSRHVRLAVNTLPLTCSNLQWYFVPKIDLTFCEKKIVLVIEKKMKIRAEVQKFACRNFGIPRTINSNMTVKGKNNFRNIMIFKLIPGGFSDLMC